jgi:diguanylate cyclase (GGDEF)-like protein
MLSSMSIIETVPLSSFGLVCFVLCQNYLTYTFFIQTGERNVILNQMLKSRNVQLEELRNSLEQKVTFRTSALAAAKEKLETLANQDPLTGLANRRYLMNQLVNAKHSSEVNMQEFCIAMIDFDYFKQINDTLGHDKGDYALKEGAKIMMSKLRDSDVLGRWGGEEFLLLARNTDIKGVEVIANKLKQSINETLSKELDTPVSVTIGIAKCGLSESVDDCLIRADTALYKGKRLGRNCVILAIEPEPTVTSPIAASQVS